MYKPNTKWTWAFLIAVLIQAVIVIALESYVFAVFQQSLDAKESSSPQNRTIPTYLTLVIFGLIYQLVLVYDSLRLKNTIQVIGLCIYNLAILIYVAIQVNQIYNAIANLYIEKSIDLRNSPWNRIRPYLIAAPCIVGLTTVIMSFIALKLYEEFSWSIYKHISADLRMRHRFLTFQIYIALLKFDFFFFLGFTVQFLVVVSAVNMDVEFYLTIVAVPVTILILVMAAYWTRRENKLGMLLIMVLYFAGSAYFIFKLVRIYQPYYSADYAAVKISLTEFGIVTLIFIVLTIINASICMSNFDKGLKPFLMDKISRREEEKVVSIMTPMPDIKHGQIPSRMTID